MRTLITLILSFALSGCFGRYIVGNYRAPETSPVAVLQMSTPQPSGILLTQVSGSSFCGKTWDLDRITVERDGNHGALKKIEAEKPMDITVIYSAAFQGPFCRMDFSFLPKKAVKYDIEVDSVGKYCYVRMFRGDKQSGSPKVKEDTFQQVYPNCSKG